MGNFKGQKGQRNCLEAEMGPTTLRAQVHDPLRQALLPFSGREVRRPRGAPPAHLALPGGPAREGRLHLGSQSLEVAYGGNFIDELLSPPAF